MPWLITAGFLTLAAAGLLTLLFSPPAMKNATRFTSTICYSSIIDFIYLLKDIIG